MCYSVNNCLGFSRTSLHVEFSVLTLGKSGTVVTLLEYLIKNVQHQGVESTGLPAPVFCILKERHTIPGSETKDSVTHN